MPAIEILSIPGEELSHDGRNAVFPALEEEMYMVVHEHPGINRALPLFNVLTKAFEKARLVFVVPEYFGFVDPPHHDVMQCAGDIQSGLTWHGASLREEWWLVKDNDTQDTTSPNIP